MNTIQSQKVLLAGAFFASAVTACSSTRSPATPALEVRTHTAGDAGFRVDSHLILGPTEALLVDAQFTRSEARKLVEEIRASKRELTQIFVTHAHPDHYLGLEVLTAEFPKARVLALPEVIADMKATAAGKLAYWKPMYKDDLADKIVTPEAFTGRALAVDGLEVDVLKMDPAESDVSAVLYVPSLKALVSGDLVYSRTHLWLAEERPEEWLRALAKIRGLVGPIERVLPGHGPAGGPELFATDETYIRDYLGATKGLSKAQAPQAIEGMKRLYPDYALPVILELSVGARLK